MPAIRIDKSMVKIGGYRRTLLWVLLLSPLGVWAQYSLHVAPVDTDSLFIQKKLGLVTSFKSRDACTEYIYNFLSQLQEKDYITASIDSVLYGPASANIHLYLGHAYRWAQIDTRKI